MTTVRQDGEAPPTAPKALAAAAAAALSATVPAPRTQADLGALLGQMDTPAAWQASVRSHFKGSDSSKTALLAELDSAKHRLGLRDAEVVVLQKALLSRFADAGDAVEALAGLRDTKILSQVLNPSPSPGEASRKAWQLAAHLQAVPGLGLRLLGQLSHQDDNAESGAFETSHRPLVRAYFEAAQEVARWNGHPQDLDPHTIYSQGNLRHAINLARKSGGDDAWPGRHGARTPSGVALTLAEKALLALRDAANPDNATLHGCAFALHMLHGGMRTDEKLDPHGKLSEYHKAESRACKTFGKHLDRAIAAEQKAQGGGLMAGLRPRKNKSPFFAYDRLFAKDKVGFGLAHGNGVHDGRAVKDMVGVVKSAYQDFRGHQEVTQLRRRDIAQPTTNHLTRIRHECRLAILALTESETVVLPRFADAQPISEAQLMRAKAQVLPRLITRHDMTEQQKAALAAQVESILRQENLGLTPQTLLAWGHAAGGPSNATQLRDRAQVQRTQGAPDWAAFEAAYLHSTQAALPSVDTPPLKGATRQAAGAQLAEMVRGEELGTGFTLENGGFTQVRTGEVAGLVSRVFLGGIASVGVDLGGGNRRTVTFESGVDPARSFIKVGVSQFRQVQAGVGIAAGVEVGDAGAARAAVGGGVDTQHAYEMVRQEGTIFAFPRNLSGGATDDQALSDKKAQLLEILVAVAGAQERTDQRPRPANPEDQGSLIKAAYQAFGGEISVGRYEAKATNHQDTVRAKTETRMTFGPVAVSLPEADLGKSEQTERTEYSESSGSLRVKKVAIREASQVKGGLSIGGLQDVSLLQGTADISRSGTIKTTNRVMLDGEELPLSFATVDYLKPGDFAHAVESGLEAFARDKSAAHFGDRHEADPATSTQAEKQTMVNFAARVMNERDLTATPQLYYEFGNVVDAANVLEADAAVSQLVDTHRARTAQRKAAALHEDPANQQGRFLFSANARSLGSTAGMNDVLGLTQTRVNEFTEKSSRYT